MLWYEICGDISFLEIRLVEEFIQKIYVRLYPFYCNFSQCTDHFADSIVTVFVIDDNLRNHGIVVWWNCIVIVYCGVYTYPISSRQM